MRGGDFMKDYEYPYNDELGNYRYATIGGKRIKIYEKLGLAESMKKSNKFKKIINKLKKENKEENNYGLSEELIKEIQNKTYKNFENIEDVEMYETNKLIKFKELGGYRTKEQLEDLKNEIIKKGIEKPIEIIKENNDKIKIRNGNHRLDIAKKIGLEKVPIKYIKK